jgi:PAS domain S-box-containing protein
MSEYKRIVWLILVMTAVVAGATATAIGMLYETAYERERLHLIANVRHQARIMESMAQFDASSRHSDPGPYESAALAQIKDAYSRHQALSDTAELTLARLEGDQIVFLMRHRHEETGQPDPVGLSSGLAEPMIRALEGRSGSMVGRDYHGQTVLAAYEPVAGLGLGVVAKVDLAEIRAPFIRTGAAVVGIAFVLIALGTVVFINVTNPIIAGLREREQKLDLLLASTGEGIFGMDTEGRCTFANRSAIRLLGYEDHSDLMGRDMHELMHHTRPDGSPHPREDCPVMRSLRQDTAVHSDEETLWRGDGSSFPAEYRSYPMHLDGKLVGAVVTFVDITERKTRELELVHAQKMEVLGQLTGGIAHDFNNLLTIITGNLQLLTEDEHTAADPELEELIDDALSAANDGAAMTQRLLAFSRKQKLMPRPLDINAFVRESVSFLRRITGEDIQLELRLASGQLFTEVDRAQLHGALLNLAINSRDAMPDGGHLILETRHASADERSAEGRTSGRYVVISVTDSGSGMTTAETRRAFEPFYTRKQPGKGSGLGLSMVYGFVRQSGGEAVIRSTPESGTTVSLYLPETKAESIAAESIAAESGEDPPVPSECAGTILVVEDEPRVRRLIERSLLTMGYRVLLAGNAPQARALLEDRAVRPDVLLSDIVMPGDMDGRALARWAVTRQPNLRVLLTTGFSRERHPGSADDWPVLGKPFGRRALANALENVLKASPPGSRESSRDELPA